MEKDFTLSMADLPLDILTEIFSHSRGKYSEFRSLCKSTNKVKISWDGWDSLIEQGVSVQITKMSISWRKNEILDRSGGLPAVEWHNGFKEWRVKGKIHLRGEFSCYRVVRKSV